MQATVDPSEQTINKEQVPVPAQSDAIRLLQSSLMNKTGSSSRTAHSSPSRSKSLLVNPNAVLTVFQILLVCDGIDAAAVVSPEARSLNRARKLSQKVLKAAVEAVDVLLDVAVALLVFVEVVEVLDEVVDVFVEEEEELLVFVVVFVVELVTVGKAAFVELDVLVDDEEEEVLVDEVAATFILVEVLVSSSSSSQSSSSSSATAVAVAVADVDPVSKGGAEAVAVTVRFLRSAVSEGLAT